MAATTARRPRLLVLNQYYWPGVEATANVLTDLCEALADEYDVTVVAGTVAGRARAGREHRNGVEIVRVPATAFERRRLWRRGANYLSYVALATAAGIRAARPDIILSMTDPPLVPDVAYAVARRFRVPLVVISQDVFPEVAVALGRLESRVVAGLLGRLVGLPFRRADRVVAIGETMRRRLEAKSVAPERISVIPNWVDTEQLTPEPRRNAWSHAQGLDDAFVVMHSGNLGYAQDLDSLVAAAAHLRDADDVRVVMVGGGARRADLVALAGRLDAQVTFLPYQPRAVLPQSLSAADVHVVGLARGLAGLVVPSRIYGVLAVARPVIAAAEEESETAQLVREAQCGVVVPPGHPERLANAIRAARDGSLDLGEMGRRGREWVVAEADRGVALARYRALLREVRSARRA